jgi:hypothetical protein
LTEKVPAKKKFSQITNKIFNSDAAHTTLQKRTVPAHWCCRLQKSSALKMTKEMNAHMPKRIKRECQRKRRVELPRNRECCVPFALRNLSTLQTCAPISPKTTQPLENLIEMELTIVWQTYAPQALRSLNEISTSTSKSKRSIR